MKGKFSAKVDKFVRVSDARLEAVFKESVVAVIDIAQRPRAKNGNMPVDTAFLRNSGAVSFDGMPLGPSREEDGIPGEQDYALEILGAAPGRPIWFGWTAAYARRREYGFTGTDSLGRTYSEQGAGFLRGAVMQWKTIVDGKVQELKARLK